MVGLNQVVLHNLLSKLNITNYDSQSTFWVAQLCALCTFCAELCARDELGLAECRIISSLRCSDKKMFSTQCKDVQQTEV